MVPWVTSGVEWKIGDAVLRAERSVGQGRKSMSGLTSENGAVGGVEDMRRYVGDGAPPAEPVGGT